MTLLIQIVLEFLVVRMKADLALLLKFNAAADSILATTWND